MFGLLTRASHSRKPLSRPAPTPRLETLEDRLSPAVIGGEVLTMDVTYLQGRQATFTGQLTYDGHPVANEGINLNGVVKASTTTDSNGNYNITLSIPQLGSETAQSADGKSNYAVFPLQGGSPVINDFTATPEGNGLWLLSGYVTGAPAIGEIINFGGITPLQGQSTAVNSDGSFDFYAIIPTGEGGTATAQAVDWWGDTSEIEGDYIAV